MAAVLFTAPDLLLLDEPTNYLDLEGTLWLQDYLARYPHSVLLISHDRDLLDASVEHILHLDQGKLQLWKGSYTTFAKSRAIEIAVREKAAKKQEDKRAHLQSFVDRFRAKATKARQAQSRLKMLEKMETVTTIVETDVPPFVIPEPQRKASPPIITMEGASVGYAEGQRSSGGWTCASTTTTGSACWRQWQRQVDLPQADLRPLKPMAGRLVRADKLKIAYFAQHQLDELRPAESVYQHLRRLMPDEPEAKVRAACARAGFSGERSDTKVSSLSGGEKARLLFAIAVFDGPNLLILDEPTNHLDIDSRAALVEALNGYAGAVMIVSHDRHLLEATVDRLWLVRDGTVKPFDGDLDDYRKIVLSGPAPAGDKSREARRPEAAGRAARRDQGARQARRRGRGDDGEAAGGHRQDRPHPRPARLFRGPSRQRRPGREDPRASREAARRGEEAWLEASAALEAAGG